MQHFWTDRKPVLRIAPFPEGAPIDEVRIWGSAIEDAHVISGRHNADPSILSSKLGTFSGNGTVLRTGLPFVQKC